MVRKPSGQGARSGGVHIVGSLWNNGGMSEQGRPSTGAGTAVMDAPDAALDLASQWVTIVWDDPVNLMTYVAYVFMEYFKYPRTKAEKLMLEVHTHGKAVVSTGNRESMERDVMAMQNYTLWATMERA